MLLNLNQRCHLLEVNWDFYPGCLACTLTLLAIVPPHRHGVLPLQAPHHKGFKTQGIGKCFCVEVYVFGLPKVKSKLYVPPAPQKNLSKFYTSFTSTDSQFLQSLDWDYFEILWGKKKTQKTAGSERAVPSGTQAKFLSVPEAGILLPPEEGASR